MTLIKSKIALLEFQTNPPVILHLLATDWPTQCYVGSYFTVWQKKLSHVQLLLQATLHAFVAEAFCPLCQYRGCFLFMQC